MQVKRKCEFVETPSGQLYLPRPSSWIGGWARHLWFQHCLDQKPSIASPDLYEELSTRYGECQLIEYEMGVIRVIEPIESGQEI
tara:strand:+ start:53 stop:304 length:252 start_codon:yes stop_codon:yes gene_type:complete